jgi:predicted RNA binding protein YcfA (HicA-like mRNA interferase family)
VGQKDLPLASGERHARAFERCGWKRVRVTSGKNPHIILEKKGVRATLSIPNHKGKDVKRALLQKQVKLAGLTEQEYLDCFHS